MAVLAVALTFTLEGTETARDGLAGVSNFVGWELALAFGIPNAIGLISGPFGDQSFWQRAFSIKRKSVFKSFVFGAMLFAVVPLSMGIIGIVAGGIVERGGRVRSFVTADTTQLTLQGLVALNVQKGAVVNTDEFRGYGDLSEKGYVHNRVNHSAKLYVDGKAYTNGIESVWSLVKRGFYGTFHKFTLEHLQRYVDEFDFRWNEGNCKVPTDERIDSLVCGCWGKSLNYKTLVA